MKHVENIRAFLRPVRFLTAERQREMLEPLIGDTSAVFYEAKERDHWVRSLRSDEMALVARLEVIAETRDKVRRPLVDFTAALADIIQRAHVVVEAETGITSHDGKRWRDLVELTARRLATGSRRLPKAEARRMATKRWARAEPGVVRRWLSHSKAAARAKWAQHYRDPIYPSARAAFEAMPEEIRAEIGSLKTAERIFGRRRPGDPSAGGRPPKRRRKK